jgi:hypothetical protein
MEEFYLIIRQFNAVELLILMIVNQFLYKVSERLPRFITGTLKVSCERIMQLSLAWAGSRMHIYYIKGLLCKPARSWYNKPSIYLPCFEDLIKYSIIYIYFRQ